MKRRQTNIFIVLLISTFFLVGVLERHFHSHLNDSSKKRAFFRDDVFTNRYVPFLPFSSFPMFSDRLDNRRVSELFVVGISSDGSTQKVPLELYTPFWDRGYQLSLQNAVLSGKKISDHATLLFDHIQDSRIEKFDEIKLVYGVYDFNTWVRNKEKRALVTLSDAEVLFTKVYK